MENESIIVTYKTQKSYCPCCNQMLPQVETSGPKNFEIAKETAECWTDWDTVAEFPEDMDSLVDEFIHETISFFSVNTLEKIIIEDSQVDKVREWILTVIVPQLSAMKKGVV